MTTAISIQNVSKAYRLGVIGHGTLREDLQSWWARVRGKEDPNRIIGSKEAIEGDTLWALRDVSFDVEQGSVWGIIGANGAGKSTLLKILSRVTAPTSGQIKVRGRVASLLEVGTGFHPELTGRENIFLNGAILGMTKAEVRKKFDEIVAFSEIEKFIDTPVKRYSSGMYVRLAFAVAAHLDPEILVVDEVLAVGDAAFQKKCLGKMGDVAKEGRTVLFVSHNMGAVRTLCEKVALMRHGRLDSVGDPVSQIARYMDNYGSGVYAELWAKRPRTELMVRSVRVWNQTTQSEWIAAGDHVRLEADYFCDIPDAQLVFTFTIRSALGEKVLHMDTGQVNFRPSFRVGRLNHVRCDIPRFPLGLGQYYLTCRAASGHHCDVCNPDLPFQVSSADFYHNGRPAPLWGGYVYTACEWSGYGETSSVQETP